jgi:hypothetical protein
MDPETIRRRIRKQLAEQRALVGRLLALREQIQGSLFTRYGECGKENCACREGRKHGPYYVLSARSGGSGDFSYLKPEKLEEARALVTRYREFRRGLRRLKTLNLNLVRLLKGYQRSMSEKGGERLGLASGTRQKSHF